MPGGTVTARRPIHARPKASAEVAQAFPRLKMVLAHMGGLKLEDEVLAFWRGAQMYILIPPWAAHL